MYRFLRRTATDVPSILFDLSSSKPKKKREFGNITLLWRFYTEKLPHFALGLQDIFIHFGLPTDLIESAESIGLSASRA